MTFLEGKFNSNKLSLRCLLLTLKSMVDPRLITFFKFDNIYDI